MKTLGIIGLLAAAMSAGCGGGEMSDTSERHVRPGERRGGFILNFRGAAKGNRFRVNSPDTSEGPYADRREAKQSGRMRITVGDDLAHVAGADLYLELWGGHPGVRDKRFTLNKQGEYVLPEVGAARKNCTYSYPDIPLNLADLRTGANTLQFTCDKGSTFWGHYIVSAATIRLFADGDHPRLAGAGLEGFSATVTATPGEGESMRLGLDCAPEMRKRIASVEYQAHYTGYDENGNGEGLDWHGFTKDHSPMAIAGVGEGPRFEASWDLSMVPDQADMSVRALVRFKDQPQITYHTAALGGLATPPREQRVSLCGATDLPHPFWSRAGKKPACSIPLEVDPAEIRRAQLHLIVWEGGRGKVRHPLSLNGHDLPTPDWKGRHEPIYAILEIDPALLRRGDNRVQMHSDTEHHGIEVCLPGPALMIRTVPNPAQR
jgi:hypothetical protein